MGRGGKGEEEKGGSLQLVFTRESRDLGKREASSLEKKKRETGSLAHEIIWANAHWQKFQPLNCNNKNGQLLTKL
jgi:hypothetical protein